MNQTKSFNGGNGKGMRKATHPSGVMCSSNPCHWRGWRLHRHGGGACHAVCPFCVLSDLWLNSRTCRTYVLEVLQSEPPRLAPYQRPFVAGITSLEDVASPSSPIPDCHYHTIYTIINIITITIITIITVITVLSLETSLWPHIVAQSRIRQTIKYVVFWMWRSHHPDSHDGSLL
jgi:hypothetical protein